jgi:hypothetical protein
MPNDPALVRQGIAQFQAANQSATNAVNAVDPAAWAAEMQLRNPLLRTWEAGGGTQGRPLPSTMQAAAPRFMPGQAPLAQQVGLSTMPGLPMSAVRGGMTSMNRFLDSRAGRDAVGQQMLQQAIEQTYGRLGGLAGTGLNITSALAGGGQGAAAQTGQFGANMASNVGNLLAQQGAAQAGGVLAGAAPFANLAALPGQLVGLNLSTGGSLFGGGRAPAPR